VQKHLFVLFSAVGVWTIRGEGVVWFRLVWGIVFF